MKIVMVSILLAVLAALAGAGVLMLRKGRNSDPRGKHMARALALRVALSVALFLLIMLGWALGWVRPGGLPTGG